MWKDSIRNIVVIFQSNILRIVGFYVRHSASIFGYKMNVVHMMQNMIWTPTYLKKTVFGRK